MGARVIAIMGGTSGAQQKDNLCGPFWAARVLNESGYSTWDGRPIDSDLIALRARTLLPEAHPGPDVPPGAVSLTDYQYELPTGPVEQSGTSAQRLASAIEAASAGELRVVSLRGQWTAARVERLVEEARALGVRLIANLRTGRLWGGRPSVEVLLGELEGQSVQEPAADWDVGHFVELEMLIRGPKGSLVIVHDSYPSLGWAGRHLQPPRAVAAALLRGDGREGGVLAVGPKEQDAAMKALAGSTGLDVGGWDNGTRS
jgi:uncharacterized protein DUF6885